MRRVIRTRNSPEDEITNASSYDDLQPLLRRFRYITAIRYVKISLYLASFLAFKPPTEAFPWDDLRKIFQGCQRMAKVPNGIDTLPKISTG